MRTPPVFGHAEYGTSHLWFFGDVYLDRPFSIRGWLPAQYVINLEGPIGSEGERVPGKINLRMLEPWALDAFPHPPAAVNLANNHIMDFGTRNLERTMAILKERQVPYFGVGTEGSRCGNPLILELAGRKVALMGYVCPTTSPTFAKGDGAGVRPIEMTLIGEDVRVAKNRGAELIVVSLHWGTVDHPLPTERDRRIAASIIAKGADLVVGHHAHRVQGWERVHGRCVFYGLGNLVFPDFITRGYSSPENPAGRQIRKSWHPWNRVGLGVGLDLHSGAVTREAVWVGESGGVERGVPGRKQGELPRLSRKYAVRWWANRSVMWVTKAALGFVRNPRLPSARTIAKAKRRILRSRSGDGQ